MVVRVVIVDVVEERRQTSIAALNPKVGEACDTGMGLLGDGEI